MSFKLTLLSACAVVFLSSCSHSIPADQSSIQGYAITPKAGPVIGSLEGAPVQIKDHSGTTVAVAKSDASGSFVVTVNPGTYSIEAQPIPGDKLRIPPTAKTVTLKAGEVSFDTLFYDAPYVRNQRGAASGGR